MGGTSMRKALSTLLIISTLFCMIATMTGCGDKADYPAPLDVCAAYKGGEDVVGKTVQVTANNDNMYGVIFNGAAPDFSYMVVIYAEGDGADEIKAGDKVLLKIASVEESLAQYTVHCTMAE